MTAREFATWASTRGIPDRTIEELLQYAASPEEMEEACDAMEPAPPIYTLDDIVEMTDKDPYGVFARANGLIVVGGCPNGDPIAIDLADEPGSVWYICHETMSARPVREVSIRVASDLTEMQNGMARGGFPYDYFDARDRARPSGGVDVLHPLLSCD
jgi:hypothetical protein